jgi:DNA polymerase-4
MQIFRDVTPHVEPISLDEAFLDVTGAKRLLGDGRTIGKLIRERVEAEQGITCSVGISHNKFIAKLASQHCKPNGMLEIPIDRVLTFLHPLPASAIWGVGPKTNEQLEKLGLRTVGEIANTPRSTLIRALGEAAGSSLYELAWGRDYRDVVTDEPEKSISAAETFASDIDDPEEILREFLRLCEKATLRMRSAGYCAKTISIKVRFADFKTISRSKTLDQPISGTKESFEVAKSLYQALKIDRARIRLVGVSLEGLIPVSDAPEQLLLGQREVGWKEADSAIDRVKARFGRGSVRPARLVTPEEDD